MPLTDSVCPLASILIPLLPRSGKFGTPWLRMQFENASVELVELEPLAVEVLAALVGELVGLVEVDPFGESSCGRHSDRGGNRGGGAKQPRRSDCSSPVLSHRVSFRVARQGELLVG